MSITSSTQVAIHLAAIDRGREDRRPYRDDWHPRGMEAVIPMIPVFTRQVRLQGCLNGSWRDRIDLVEFLATQDIRPVIDRSFRLEELPEAFQYEESGSHFGKIVIEV